MYETFGLFSSHITTESFFELLSVYFVGTLENNPSEERTFLWRISLRS